MCQKDMQSRDIEFKYKCLELEREKMDRIERMNNQKLKLYELTLSKVKV